MSGSSWKRRHQFALLVAVAAVSYCVWRQRRARVSSFWSYVERLSSAISTVQKLLALSTDIGTAVLQDVHTFLTTDTDRLPTSFLQCLKLASSDAVHDAILGVAKSVLSSGQPSGSGVVDKIIDATLSPRGQTLITLCISRGCTDFVDTIADKVWARSEQSDGGAPSTLDSLLQWLGTPTGQLVVNNAVTAFVTHGVEVYCDKTAGLNTYDDLLASISKPDHLRTMQALTQTFCHATVSAAFRRRARDEVHPLTPRRSVAMQPDAAALERFPPSMHDDRENIAVLPHDAKPPSAPGQSEHEPSAVRACAEQLIDLSRVPEMRALMVQCSHAGCAGAVEGAFSAYSRPGGGAAARRRACGPAAAPIDAADAASPGGDEDAGAGGAPSGDAGGYGALVALGRAPEFRELVKDFAHAGFSGGTEAGIRTVLGAVTVTCPYPLAAATNVSWYLLFVACLLLCLHVLSPWLGRPLLA